MILPVMAEYGRLKGIDILSVSDWTHGLWFKEIKSQLEEKFEGVYKLKTQIANLKTTTKNSKLLEREPLFLLSTEISCIYSQGGRLRRIHNLIFAPNFETAEKINKELFSRGCNLLSDGRPIIGLSSKALLELVLSIDKRVMLIPCHAWTPHFGIYGSASGFDSLEECFGELSSNIYAIETGLSSDPEMNWQIKELEDRSIVSFSDAHSPAKMGREATVFVSKNGPPAGGSNEEKITYEDIRQAIMRKSDKWKIGYTIEFYPEEGKYHYSGHRNCGVVLGPEEIKNNGNICSVCKRPLTEGVLFRVQQLGEGFLVKSQEKINSTGLRWHTDPSKNQPPFVKLVPLLEIIAESLNSTVSSQKVKDVFDNLCISLDSEINVLLKSSIEDIEKVAGPKVAEGVLKVRKGDIIVAPGYDGEYGKVKIWNEKGISDKKKEIETKEENQLGLF